jgi:hypothetical protein
MLIAMLLVQGLMAWHARVHVLENHGMSAGHTLHHHHDAGDICSLCAFAQDFAKLVPLQAPVLHAVAIEPYYADSAVTTAIVYASARPYIARAPPAA